MSFNPSWKDFWAIYEQADPDLQSFMKKELNDIISHASKGVKEEILEYAPNEFKNLDSYEVSPTMMNLIRQPTPPMSESECKKVDQLLARARERKKNTPSRYVRQEERYTMRRGMYSIFRALFGGRY